MESHTYCLLLQEGGEILLYNAPTQLHKGLYTSFPVAEAGLYKVAAYDKLFQTLKRCINYSDSFLYWAFSVSKIPVALVNLL